MEVSDNQAPQLAPSDPIRPSTCGQVSLDLRAAKQSYQFTMLHQHHTSQAGKPAKQGQLTYWGRDNMGDIFQMTFSNAFSSMKM